MLCLKALSAACGIPFEIYTHAIIAQIIPATRITG